MSRRPQVLSLAVGALVVPLVLGTTAVTQAQTAAPVGSVVAAETAKTDATPAHPYSDPVYLPVRQPFEMDCYKKNPAEAGYPSNVCKGHSDWQMTLLSLDEYDNPDKPGDQSINEYDDKIYAMGAGRIVYTRPKGDSCAKNGGGATNLGIQVEISHGGSTVSRYGHMEKIATNPDTGDTFAVGDLVDAGQLIGVMGNTGAQGNCKRPYLDFWIETAGVQQHFRTLEACVAKATQTWPAAQYGSYGEWNDVPKATLFPNPKTLNDVPDGSCLPTGEPTTVDKPANPRLKRAGSETLRASWKGQPAGTKALAYLEIYRVTTKSWSPQAYGYTKPGTGSYTFKGLKPDGARARVQLSYKNSTGWSEATPFVETTIGAPSDKPKLRRVQTAVVKKTGKAFIRLGWGSGARHGFEPTHYVVEIRAGKGAWKAKSLSRKSYTYLFGGLKKRTAYQVRVKSTSGAGDSAYLTRSIKTPKK